MDSFKEPTPVRLFNAGYIYLKNGEFCSEDDLVVSYLAKNAKQTDGIQLFSTKKELLEIIERMEQEEYQQSNEQNLELAKQYSIENVANIYRELLGMEG